MGKSRRDVAASIARVLKVFGTGIGSATRNLCVLGGAGSIAYGAWMIYEPAGFIVGGILLIAGSVVHELAQVGE